MNINNESPEETFWKLHINIIESLLYNLIQVNNSPPTNHSESYRFACLVQFRLNICKMRHKALFQFSEQHKKEIIGNIVDLTQLRQIIINGTISAKSSSMALSPPNHHQWHYPEILYIHVIYRCFPVIMKQEC